MNFVKKMLIVGTATLVALTAGVVQADLSYNIALTSDYRYRGISQTKGDPALQGGVDFTSDSGFYLGTWASTIEHLKDEYDNKTSKAEIDVYGGYRSEVNEIVSYDLGVLAYTYPRHAQKNSPNTTEVYGQLTLGPTYIKYSHAVTDLFGTEDSDNSGYIDLGMNLEITERLIFNLHVGRQNIKNDDAYVDYLAGMTYDFDFMTGAITIIETDIKGDVEETDKTLVITLKKTF
jgi:uncharacterized protein (TIGR02001 family)